MAQGLKVLVIYGYIAFGWFGLEFMGFVRINGYRLGDIYGLWVIMF